MLNYMVTFIFISQTFVGSTSRDLIVYNWFATNLKTRYLRIVPMTWETGICLRVNVYGCPSSGRKTTFVRCLEWRTIFDISSA